MLTITVLGQEFFNEADSTFVTKGDVVLELEHSLATLSKWESIYKKPFLGNEEKTTEEVFAYIKIMCLTPDVDPDVFTRLTKVNFDTITKYLEDSQTATWFAKETASKKPTAEAITAELIYFWMITYNVPFECEHWHLNKLFTLIRVCSAKNSKPKKESPQALAEKRKALNEQRKLQYGTTG